jgi:hypothetical protein
MKKNLTTLFTAILIFVISNAKAQEFKIGITQHDFDTKLNHRVEKGQNIIIEYLLDKLDNYLRAYPHIGARLIAKAIQAISTPA